MRADRQAHISAILLRINYQIGRWRTTRTGLRGAGADRTGLRHQHSQSEREKRPLGTNRPLHDPYQLEQFGKLVLTYRTRLYLLDMYFDTDHLMMVTEPLSQARLFVLHR